jgi:RNA polymerase sigma-70 factor, ECF subfamily
MLAPMPAAVSVDATDRDAELAVHIVQAAPGRAQDAEAELYRRLAPRVRRYGLRHLRDADAAADLMQHVMVFTLEQLRAGQLREPHRITSYVFGVCRMTLLDMRRGSQRRDELLERHGDDMLSIADIAVAPRLDHQRVADCLERLPERERSVIVLTFYEDKPADEVAGALGLSAGNVRVIRHRSIGRLRDCLGARRSVS